MFFCFILSTLSWDISEFKVEGISIERFQIYVRGSYVYEDLDKYIGTVFYNKNLKIYDEII